MEMEFKDNSRRRTLVLVVGVLLALGAGIAAFTLSSQSGDEEPMAVLPTRTIVVAANPLPARSEVTRTDLATVVVPIDQTNDLAYTDPDQIVGRITAIPVLQNQPLTDNMFASDQTGQLQILRSGETISPTSPVLRAVSLTVPNDRAVAGLVGTGQRVDIIATVPIAVELPVDPETGETSAVDPETGDPLSLLGGSSTKLMWLDTEIMLRPEGSDIYVVRTDLQTAEEIAHAQNQGAQFTMALRPGIDTRDVDRSNYGETTDTIIQRYNFRVPESIDGAEYPQPIAFPSPFPAEPYLSPPPEPSPSPESALIDVPEAPEESPAP